MPVETKHLTFSQTPQEDKSEQANIVQFKLPSAQAIDGLVQYFDNLRINDRPVEAKFLESGEELGTVRVSFPLPIASIADAIDLKTLGGMILSLESQSFEK